MNNHRYPQPVIPVTGQILTSGTFGDLKDKAGTVSIGLFDNRTHGIATPSGNGNVFYIGYSSEHTRDKLDKFYFGMTNGKASMPFRGSDVISFEYSNPQKVSGETWTFGYNGTTGCNEKNPVFECGKTYGLRITAGGSPTFRRWAKTLEHEIYVTTPCCDSDDCATGCPDGKVGAKTVVRQFAEAINTHNELSQLGFKARWISSDYSAPSANMYKYEISICDEGDAAALGRVQLTVGSLGKATRKSRLGSVSTYEVCAVSSPSAFQPETPISLATCGTCPTGYTLVEAQDAYTIVRPLAGTEDLTTNYLKQVYANTIAIAYGLNSVAATFNGATAVEVVAASDAITITGHGLHTGDAVVYADGGGTQIVGLTDTNTYWVIAVDANTIKLASSLANAQAHTAIAIADGVGAAHTLTLTNAKFLSSNGSTAQIEVRVPTGDSAPVAILADSVVAGQTVAAYCDPFELAEATAWSQVGTAYRGQRQLCISLNRVECTDGNRDAELEALFYDDANIAGTPGSKVTTTAGDACRDSYTITQWSDGCASDGCFSSDTLNFSDVQGVDNEIWTVVEGAVEEYDADVKVGLEITATLPEKYFSDCAMSINDFYETDPIRFEVSWIVNEITGLVDTCSIKNLPKAKKTVAGKFGRQSGEFVLRDVIKHKGAYELFGADYDSPRLREVTDSNIRSQVDRKAYYKAYYIQYKVLRGEINFGQAPEVCEAIIYFKETDPKAAAFESTFGSVFSKFGITLQERK